MLISLKNSPLFGIEQEHFILKEKQQIPSEEDITNLFILLQDYGYSPHQMNEKGKVGSILKRTKDGPIIIKTDFCTHILEVAFPPFENPFLFKELYLETWSHIKEALAQLDIEVLYGGVLPKQPLELNLYAPDHITSARQQALLNRQIPNLSFSCLNIFAMICSTQVHLNVEKEELYQHLNKLYGFEYLIPLLFSTGQSLKDQKAHCVRPLIYRDSFESSYLAYAYPERIPTSEAEYRLLLKNAEGFLKDYSLIVPREDLSTIEFRSACAQENVDTIIELIALRLAILAAAKKPLKIDLLHKRRIFHEVCEKGKVDPHMLEYDLETIITAMELPTAFMDPFINITGKIKRMIDQNHSTLRSGEHLKIA